MTRAWLVIAVASFVLACRDLGTPDLAETGRRAYVASCSACHDRDPKREGVLGPAIAGSSRELIEARVMRAAYPPGYEPKRDTNLMPAQPYLKQQIEPLAAYLALP